MQNSAKYLRRPEYAAFTLTFKPDKWVGMEKAGGLIK